MTGEFPKLSGPLLEVPIRSHNKDHDTLEVCLERRPIYGNRQKFRKAIIGPGEATETQ